VPSGDRPRLRLGVNLPTRLEPAYDPVNFALEAERLGFDFVSSSDHPAGSEPNFETWTLLAFVAAQTSRIHVATRVLGLPYRAPAMVAKMAETLSRLSGGRVVLGLGSGHGDDEHRAFGVAVRTAKEKTDALEEALEVIRGLWSKPTFSLGGRYYSVVDAELEPKPSMSIPIWLGTFAPRSLEITGRLADGWIPTLGYASADELPRMRRRVAEAAERAGRDPASLDYILNVDVALEPAQDASLSGSPLQVVDALGTFIGHGFNGFNFIVKKDRDEQLARLATEVIPALLEHAGGSAGSSSAALGDC
jgi:alkanesulfonate monooxygenase SsuD/methylene tetrahydromethanopterin reductase-like flavin-dependent oxidoreductase (luciferase family)